MDWPAIGAWAGDKGPYVFVIGVLTSLLWRLSNRFFAQQDMVMEALIVAKKSASIAESQSTKE